MTYLNFSPGPVILSNLTPVQPMRRLHVSCVRNNNNNNNNNQKQIINNNSMSASKHYAKNPIERSTTPQTVQSTMSSEDRIEMSEDDESGALMEREHNNSRSNVFDNSSDHYNNTNNINSPENNLQHESHTLWDEPEAQQSVSSIDSDPYPALYRKNKQTRIIIILCIFFGLLLMSGIIQVLSYHSNQINEIRSFEEHFTELCDELSGNFLYELDKKVQMLDSLSSTYTIYGSHTLHTSHSFDDDELNHGLEDEFFTEEDEVPNDVWPFVTLPYFDKEALQLISITQSKTVIFAPLVRPKKTSPPEETTYNKESASDEVRLETEEKEEKKQSSILVIQQERIKNDTHDHHTSFNHSVHKARPTTTNYYENHEKNRTLVSSSFLVSDDESDDDEISFLIWQIYPHNQTRIMSDIYRDNYNNKDDDKECIQAMLRYKHPSISQIKIIYYDEDNNNNYQQNTQQENEKRYLRKKRYLHLPGVLNKEPTQETQTKHMIQITESTIYSPIFQDIFSFSSSQNNDNNNEIVGSISLTFSWEALLGSIAPSHSYEIYCVLSDGGHTRSKTIITYAINGKGNVHVIGKGDLHDVHYHNMKHSVKFVIGSNYQNIPLSTGTSSSSSSSSVDRDYEQHEHDHDHYTNLIHDSAKQRIRHYQNAHESIHHQQHNHIMRNYTLTIYPTDEFKFRYSNPKILSSIYDMLIIFLSLAMSLVFLCYACVMNNNYNALVKISHQTSKIVHSLFPASIYDRIVEQQRRSSITSNGGGTFPSRISNKNMENARSRLFNTLLKKEPSDQSVENTNNNNNQYGYDPIAHIYPETTILFADMVGFTSWSSAREPTQVFHLLETIYAKFDEIAKRLGVFKIETIGDCYVCVTGLPTPDEDHALIMARFSQIMMKEFNDIVLRLETELGPGTGDLAIRVGMHSGSVTGGVLRGDKGRFQLFGDTMNTASRMESTGEADMIQLSLDTHDLLVQAGKEHWLAPREDRVVAKGKGEMQTFWLNPSKSMMKNDSKAQMREASTAQQKLQLQQHHTQSIASSIQTNAPTTTNTSTSTTNTKRSRSSSFNDDVNNGNWLLAWRKEQARRPDRALGESWKDIGFSRSESRERLIKFCVAVLEEHLSEVVKMRLRELKGKKVVDIDAMVVPFNRNSLPKDDKFEKVLFPKYKGDDYTGYCNGRNNEDDEDDDAYAYQEKSNKKFKHGKKNKTKGNKKKKKTPSILGKQALKELHEYVTAIADLYSSDIHFHNFEHASHVTMSVNKLIKRITSLNEEDEAQNSGSSSNSKSQRREESKRKLMKDASRMSILNDANNKSKRSLLSTNSRSTATSSDVTHTTISDHHSHISHSSNENNNRNSYDENINPNRARYFHTFGLNQCPLAKFAVVFAALIHDVGHTGVPNSQLKMEKHEYAFRYENESIAEQHSIIISWNILMQSRFKALRGCIFGDEDDMRLFRQILVNTVMATDISSKKRQKAWKKRWDEAFDSSSSSSIISYSNNCIHQITEDPEIYDEDDEDNFNHNTTTYKSFNETWKTCSNESARQIDISLKAEVILELILQASDVAHTMQHWYTFVKWTCRLYEENLQAFQQKRRSIEPSHGCYEDNIKFFDSYVIPLSLMLKKTGVLGIAADECVRNARANRKRWSRDGDSVVERLILRYNNKNQNENQQRENI